MMFFFSQVALNVNNIIIYGAIPSTLSLMYSDSLPDLGLLEKVAIIAIGGISVIKISWILSILFSI